jgi:hypothetical protein
MKRPRRNPALDLFGEIPVSQNEVRAWVARTSPNNASDRMFDTYVAKYNVIDKIRAAKLAGTFNSDGSIDDPRSCPCGSGLHRPGP